MSARTTKPSRDLAATAREVARDFLQTVVLLDDQAAFGGQDSIAAAMLTDANSETNPAEGTAEGWPAAERPVPMRSRVSRRIPKLRRPPSVLIGTVRGQALDAGEIINGFAEQGLVCAVIRPGPTQSPVDYTLAAAERADIVILDWDLHGDDGASTLEIIHKLVHEVEPRGRLRLIAVYSGAPALRKIASRLRQALRKEAHSERFRSDGDFAIKGGVVRIVVFSKPTRRLERAGKALSRRVVAGSELPERLISEFSKLTVGLVPHVALKSLAALRKNMHRVLGQLRADLDAAYLWHRATQSDPADAEVHLVDLVAGELRAVLDDERVGSLANLEAIAQWVAREEGANFSDRFGAGVALSAVDVLELLRIGATDRGDENKDVREKFSKMQTSKKPHKEHKLAGFAKTPELAKRSNEHFAALMSLRTRYQHPVPRLELGTILARGRGRSRTHWLCIQPRCDSIRLKRPTAFPLLPFEQVEDNGKFDVLLPNGRGRYKHFLLRKKPSDIYMEQFAVNPPDNDAIEAEAYGKGFSFMARSKVRYVWVAELRSEQAQRFAQQIANEFSRVGLTESEWLRLWAKGGGG